MTTLPVEKSWYAPWRVRGTTFAIGLVVLCLIPNLVGDNLAIWASFLADAILLLSLGLLVRRLRTDLALPPRLRRGGRGRFRALRRQLPPPVAARTAAGHAGRRPVGAIVAIPAIRLSGLFLALATLGFGILAPVPLLPHESDVRPDDVGDRGATTGHSVLRFVAGCRTRASTTCCWSQRCSAPSRHHGDPAQPSGSPARRDGGLAARARDAGSHDQCDQGLDLLHFRRVREPRRRPHRRRVPLRRREQLRPVPLLVYVALVVIAIGGEPWYALIAALGVSIIPGYFTGSNVTTYLQIFFGLAAATYAVSRSQDARPYRCRSASSSIVSAAADRSRRTEEQMRRALVQAAASEEDACSGARHAGHDGRVPLEPGATGLEVRGLSVRFGGVMATRDVSSRRPWACITGSCRPQRRREDDHVQRVLGPGEAQTRAGDVARARRHVPRAAGRSRLGLGRSFQRVELFSSLTVRENVALGREASMAGANPVRQLLSTADQRGIVTRAVEDAMELTGYRAPDRPPGRTAPIGQRRMVELARVLAGPSTCCCWTSRPRALTPPRRGGSARSCQAVADRAGYPAGRARHGARASGLPEHLRAGLRPARLRGISRRDAGQPGRAERVSRSRAGDTVPGAHPGRRLGRAMLELDRLTAGYGETVVLRDVTISVPDSTVVALLGPNGAGKTTTLRTASGLIKPMAGRVLLDGQDVTGQKPYALARRGLCHLPEGHGIFPSLTVKENIVLSSPKGKEKESVEKAGDQFPALADASRSAGGKPEWRRAADALLGEDLRHEPQDRGGGRGVPRAVAAPRRPGLRGAAQIVVERHFSADRRAVRDACT